MVLGIASPTTLMPLQTSLDTAFAVDQNQQIHQLKLLSSQQQQHGSTGSLLGQRSSSTGLLGASASSAGLLGASASSASLCSSAAGAVHAGAEAPAGDASNGSAGVSPVPPQQQQLVSPSAMPVPRMSNAFARKHGLDPKENPLVNLQRLAMQQHVPQQQPVSGGLGRLRGGGLGARACQ